MSSFLSELMEQHSFFERQGKQFIEKCGEERAWSPVQKQQAEQLIERYTMRLARILSSRTDAKFDVVLIGMDVRIQTEEEKTDQVTLCFPEEEDANKGKLSFLSPMGMGMLLTRLGQVFRLTTSSGEKKYRVVEIQTPSMPRIDEIHQMLETKKQHQQDRFRPGYHFSPPSHWLNDPNGLVYYEGVYHLFYQHHPHGNQWGPMHWGHAVSSDLIHWEHMPIALFPDEHGAIFSGCCVVDWNNSSGLFEGSHGLVAIFTHADSCPKTGQPRQRQSLAYSDDQGRTWHKYKGNPVLAEEDLIDFRDSKAFWHPQSERWVMVLVAGDHVRFYGSKNLREWTLIGQFGKEEGSHDGVWECPDLFELPIDDSGRSKWVLIVSIGDRPDCPEGSRTQYFIGEFDGNTFINDNPADHVMWLDYGRDNYAGVTWSDIPAQDGRRVMIGWMSNWKYANQTPTGEWRGAMTLPRALSLTSRDEGIVLTQLPVREIEQLRKESKSWNMLTVTPEVPYTLKTEDDLLEIEADIDIRSAGEVLIKLQSAGEIETIIGYDPVSQWLFIDRTKSGITDFHPSFGCQHGVRLVPENGTIRLQIWLDRNAVEVYANAGLVVLTDQIFPDAPMDRMEISVKSGEAQLSSLHLHALKSIHVPNGAAE